MNTCIIKREQPRVSAYNLALRAGALINTTSGLLVYLHVCMLPYGALHGPPSHVIIIFSYTLTVCPRTRARDIRTCIEAKKHIQKDLFALSGFQYNEVL